VNGFADDRLCPSLLRTLLAVCVLYGRGRAVTVRGVMRLLGQASPNAVHPCLVELRRRGLVEWRSDRYGTIVPACTVEVLR
jgi:DNA-binding IclR family transcriptional regulator